MKISILKYSAPLLIVILLTLSFVLASNRADALLWICTEIICVYILIIQFKWKIRVIVWVLYCLILGGQISSIFSSGSFIIPLTLTNAAEFSALGLSGVLKIVSIVLLYVLASLVVVSTKSIHFHFKNNKRIISLIVIGGGIYFLPLPLHFLAITLQSYYKQVTYKPSYNYPEIANKYFKVSLWDNGRSEKGLTSNNKNIIVIFTEGMSSGVIDYVNKKNINITPNLDLLLGKSVSYFNYYNHTAATFRGLRGQLTSAYQYRDGWNSNNDGFAQMTPEAIASKYNSRLVSLPEILNNHGYETIFLSSTERTSTLNAMLKGMSFKEVYGMGDFQSYQEDRMTDKQTFSALKQILEKRKNNDAPFFIGVYPSGTHHGRESPDLKYKDGSNIYYNKFYNYDAQLGDFIRYFDKSNFSKNTTVIITADHSTLPTPEFKKSFGINADYFVDQIPLIIYNSGNTPVQKDAQGKNSLSLAPTILQMLLINNEPNYFLGCSLLDFNCKSEFSNTTAIGDEYYNTYPAIYPDYGVKKASTNTNVSDFYNVSG
ncbi:LTA synthase family protein [Enterobacter asburiae]|uniref:LTA synthase family protein n=1 Tax=Enterobacter asburiae TaxID=61645 RepID=UPI0020047A3D|nr:LTA synthase family protein [Enterobacter asburiae]MCK7226910.1 LTA synthase family protein [Enterobacter asburiae]